jgi:NitT/TauT family transport system permease protein
MVRRAWMDRLALACVLLVAWAAGSRLLGPYWISSPLLVLERLWQMALDGDLWFHGRFTLAEAFGGFLLGAIPGCAVAMALRRHPLVRSAFMGVAAIGYAVPKTALVPLFILWLGVGPAAKVVLVATAIFFIVLYSTLNGVDAVDQKLLSSFRVLGATEWQLLRHVVWPAVVPYVFGGLRVAVPYAIAGAIVGEIISSNRGIGYLIQFGASDFDTTLVFVALLTVMCIVLFVSAILARVQARLLQWQTAQVTTSHAVGA